MEIREGVLSGGLPFLAIGTGPPVLVFPGLSAQHANPSGMERRFQLRQWTPLAAHFTVYIVNRRPGLRPGSTIADLAKHYAGAVRAEFSQPVHVVGVSTGGSIAQQFAIDYPALVRRLVLLATACRLSPNGQAIQRTQVKLIVTGRPRRAGAAVGPTLAATRLGGWFMAALMWSFGKRMAPADPADMIATINAEDVFDASPDLHRISAPTLLVAGAKDRYYSPELFSETAARIPNARLLLNAREGHAGVISSPFAHREIVKFLTAEAAAYPE
jgi:pimeloyl-ACP methyl ester carboxylesterase